MEARVVTVIGLGCRMSRRGAVHMTTSNTRLITAHGCMHWRGVLTMVICAPVNVMSHCGLLAN